MTPAPQDSRRKQRASLAFILAMTAFVAIAAVLLFSYLERDRGAMLSVQAVEAR